MLSSRQVKATIGATVLAVAVVLVANVAFGMRFERAVLLAPVFVVCVGFLAGMLIFWGRVALAQWRGEDRPTEPDRDDRAGPDLRR